MYREVTTEQLSHAIHRMIRFRNEKFDPSVFNLAFPVTVEDCDGPNRTAIFRYHTYPWMSNLNHVVHGGIVATILDVSMATLNISFYGAVTPTISMTVNYARAVPLDKDVLVDVRVATTGGSTAQLTACMYLPDEYHLPLATSIGVYHTAQAVRAHHMDLL